MKTIKFLGVLAAALCLLAAAVPGQAQAATYAEALSRIDFSSLSISFEGDIVSVGTTIETYAEMEGDFSGSDYNTGSAATDEIEAYVEGDYDYFWSWGLYDQEELYSQAYIEGSEGTTYADSGLYGTYTAETAGTLTVSVSFGYSLETETSADEGASVYALAWSELYIGDLSVSEELFSEASYGMSFDDEKTGTLTLSFDLESGESVDFGAITGAEVSAVPIPGAVWLLASALPGVAVLRRRNRIDS
jgi:hypothetical protein